MKSAKVDFYFLQGNAAIQIGWGLTVLLAQKRALRCGM